MTTTKKKAAVVTVAAVELTDVERDFLSHWTMFGPAAVVSKVGRAGRGTPPAAWRVSYRHRTGGGETWASGTRRVV